MTSVLLATAGISGFSAVVYGAGGRKRLSRAFGALAVAAFAGYVAAGGLSS